MSGLAGRKPEIKLLKRLLRSSKAELLAVYGRRRIGKTYLIQRFFHDKGLYFEVSGIRDATIEQQIRNFVMRIKKVFGPVDFEAFPRNWFEVFELLETVIDRQKGSEKIILFLDEFPWMDTHKSDLVKAFENAWNSYLCKNPRIITIVCGSSVSWMIRKVIRNRGGLHGRLTAQIRLKPFTLIETEEFFQLHQIKLDRKQIVEIYMALGGVPKYLELAQRGMSSSQIVQDLCFNPRGFLTTEFEALYESLFDGFQLHVKIIEALAQNRIGLTFSQIADFAKVSKGGSLTKALKELVASDFVRLVQFYGKKQRESRYRLIDEYSLFYLRWIKDAMYNYDEPLGPNYWLKQQDSNAYKIWAGYTFEGVCLKHVQQIVESLKLSVVAQKASYWSGDHAQIDLIIDRGDSCANLVEIKYYNQEWAMTAKDAQKMNKRRELFREFSKSRKTLFNTLITPFGAKNNQHYLASIEHQLTLDDLFRHTDD